MKNGSIGQWLRLLLFVLLLLPSVEGWSKSGKVQMKDVRWNFLVGKFETVDEFLISLVEYNEYVLSKQKEEDASVNPKFTYPINQKLENGDREVKVVYYLTRGEEQGTKGEERSVVLKSDTGDCITEFALLYKLNNAICDELEEEEQENVFFEGVEYLGEEERYPVFLLHLGA